MLNENGREPITQTLIVRTLGTGELTWSATVDVGWVGLDSATGTTPAEVEVRLDTDAVPDRGGDAEITFTAGNLRQIVSLAVTAGGDGDQFPIRVWLPDVRK